jgi:hypothetical protein
MAIQCKYCGNSEDFDAEELSDDVRRIDCHVCESYAIEVDGKIVDWVSARTREQFRRAQFDADRRFEDN